MPNEIPGTNMPVGYVDSCIAIYHVERVAPWDAVVGQALTEFQGGLVISDLVRMECLVGPLRDADRAAQAEYRAFFDAVVSVSLGHRGDFRNCRPVTRRVPSEDAGRDSPCLLRLPRL